VLGAFGDGRARSSRELSEETGLEVKALVGSLRGLWERGMILRTETPIYETYESSRGRVGLRRNTRGITYTSSSLAAPLSMWGP
jgi:8-oxo-dGTP pyrophosphatase MutT (NUDIX family)